MFVASQFVLASSAEISGIYSPKTPGFAEEIALAIRQEGNLEQPSRISGIIRDTDDFDTLIQLDQLLFEIKLYMVYRPLIWEKLAKLYPAKSLRWARSYLILPPHPSLPGVLDHTAEVPRDRDGRPSLPVKTGATNHAGVLTKALRSPVSLAWVEEVRAALKDEEHAGTARDALEALTAENPRLLEDSPQAQYLDNLLDGPIFEVSRLSSALNQDSRHDRALLRYIAIIDLNAAFSVVMQFKIPMMGIADVFNVSARLQPLESFQLASRIVEPDLRTAALGACLLSTCDTNFDEVAGYLTANYSVLSISDFSTFVYMFYRRDLGGAHSWLVGLPEGAPILDEMRKRLSDLPYRLDATTLDRLFGWTSD